MKTVRQAVLAGMLDMSPLLLGVLPFALVAGISATAAGFSLAQAMGSSLIVYAGAAQVAAHQLMAGGAPAAVVVLTAFIINLRFLMYGASIAAHMAAQPTAWKVLIAFVLTDQGYALSLSRFAKGSYPAAIKRAYYLSLSLFMWLVWQVGTFVGAFLGASLPASWQLDFIVPLSFMALAFGAMRDRSSQIAGLVGSVGGLALAALPFNLGLLLAALLGVVAGVLSERKTP